MKDPKTNGKQRSTQWPKVRRAFLKLNPACAVCGGKKKLEAHHVMPFHLDQDKELDPTNLIALCEGNKDVNCHLVFGHVFNFKNFNPDVRTIAARLDQLRLKK